MTFPFNRRFPDQLFLDFLGEIYKYLDVNDELYKDRKFQDVLNYLWPYYKMQEIAYLAFGSVPL